MLIHIVHELIAAHPESDTVRDSASLLKPLPDLSSRLGTVRILVVPSQ